MRAHIDLGRAGEDVAADWYRSHGFHVVDRNWRTGFGEIDLVARRGRTVVICEVKTRRSAAFGSPAFAVDVAKQRRLRRLGAAWLAAQPRPRPRYDVRFDVAAIVGSDIQVFENAF